MEGRSHFAIGLATGVGLAVSSGSVDDVGMMALTIVTASVASLLPDIDEDGSLINNFLFPSLNRKFRSFALASLGVVAILLYFLKSLPLWVLLAGVFAAGVAYVPHRSVTHSLLATAYVTWTVYLISPSLAKAAAVGYLSHLLADALTRAGVPFFWPWMKKFNFSGIGIQIKSGGSEDKLIGNIAGILSAIGFVWLIGQIIHAEAVSAGWLP
ncbi:metal-dependent hydrolase [Staphylospora marina]|uniref:metal-dependent hydrolase n=1 Tax=Staphylospora marina TaxID=2490858 RepID=UPI000F5BDCA5|nr:metal-dependent hydrolase [Staphylospora marina]